MASPSRVRLNVAHQSSSCSNPSPPMSSSSNPLPVWEYFRSIGPTVRSCISPNFSTNSSFDPTSCPSTQSSAARSSDCRKSTSSSSIRPRISLSRIAFLHSWMYDSRVARASTRSSAITSSSLNSSASLTIRSTSCGDSLSLFSILIEAFLPEVVSRADTARMPSASRSNVTSICATPLAIAGKPLNSNMPNIRLSAVIFRSPSKTLLETAI
mmetsp:Transcript_46483/g.104786  ORF Transcript_46483/g.104786 Transcript_46483/m.104786 type:complete len:212 (-) Transcript_46483:448-1083(-)